MPKIEPGSLSPALELKNIHGAAVHIPSRNYSWVHLHFARYAACPLCNIHVQTLVAASRRIFAANIREVVLFHSPPKSLLPYQGNFSFDVVGDPEKEIYKKFDVGTSPRALLDPRVWPTWVRAHLGANRPARGLPENGAFSLPADFLIAPDGRVAVAHYGKYTTDVLSVEQLLASVQNVTEAGE